ncbi:type IVB secretion system protein IcmH/DotU [Duganella sp. sic0402]|uniref:type IVB secretion system protein IcmH/DotU n=1 Tax=Duganella sp. sic0402 TaxID=2854786 RepID=UPI001C46F0F9|nr:type IVB secretion system protein IcmH/DotU [Duganella sp. sic0402]MBV7535533.1 type IVB secretion system protein IcmH/DotU [Duganella sp. sic0402]
MSAAVERRANPTQMGGQRKQIQHGYGHVQTLLDLMQEGFYLLFMLKNGSVPPDEAPFLDTVTAYLAEFDREARKLRAQGEDIDAAKYAFCAALDEIILSSRFSVRLAWERRPLQLVIFGDQLAGEHFFDRLETLRSAGGSRLAALQVFHMCLLIGFRGKYALDASDKLAFLTARLGDEIAHMQGKSKGFAPQAERPDQIIHKLRSNTPIWAVSAIFGVMALSAYIGMEASLSRSTEESLAAYSDLVRLAPRPAFVTITLP